MPRKTVTLYVDDRSIRLMQTSGKNIRVWASASLEPGLIEGGIVVDEEKVIAKVRRLLTDRRITTKKVILGLSGLRSLTLAMDLPQLPDNLLAEAVMRECARVLPVPLEELYVSWITLPPAKKRIRAFAAAIQRNSADSILNTLSRAGLTPCMMDIKPLALARLANKSTAVIVDVQSRDYDIIIINNGIPQPVRSIPLPVEGLSWQEKLSMIMDDLVRTMEFFDTNNPESPFAADMPIYISGELANEADICKSMSTELGRPILPLLLPFKYPQSWRQNYYAINAGLALKSVSPAGKLKSLITKLDTLPPAYQPKSFSLRRVLTLTGAVVVCSIIIPLAAIAQIGSSDINGARAQLETMTADLDRKVEQRRELTLALNRTKADLNAFTVALESLETQQDTYNEVLQVVTGLLPNDVAFREINHDTGTVTLEVDTLDETSVLDYGRSLQSNDAFSEVSVSKMKRLECEITMRFMIILKVKE
ncbi:MAG TPA: pilus assembly protein PilM [Dehalococcoidia bacterium]|nr:pilus assembly protein PilM [Dehalococcoidia bacterium]